MMVVTPSSVAFSTNASIFGLLRSPCASVRENGDCGAGREEVRRISASEGRTAATVPSCSLPDSSRSTTRLPTVSRSTCRRWWNSAPLSTARDSRIWDDDRKKRRIRLGVPKHECHPLFAGMATDKVPSGGAIGRERSSLLFLLDAGENGVPP
jgi:hypothetical protein